MKHVKGSGHGEGLRKITRTLSQEM